MKRTQIFFMAMVVALVCSCNFTEEIYFNEDGTGRLNISFDGNEMFGMLPADSTRTNEVIDSTLVFKEMLVEKRDSISMLSAKEQENLKRLEPFSLRMQMNEAEELMLFDMFADFEDISEMNNAFNTFQSAAAVGPSAGSKPMPNGAENEATKVSYEFNDNKFRRVAKIVDQEMFERSKDSLQSAEMFLGSSNYTFKYHFPRRIKETNLEEATFSMDGKTLIYKVNFLDVLKDPEAFLIEVELED
ncbi:hypothetical protein [Allomuricauda sp. F6463D]|uniref:hypothetical protein n=1 Tax=Allomuricauda sp. F6463D TaxID=2926409 RepID=UPI001FF4C15F|nr:hypothetical protein [Muricauda sp. F6463D]MCK0161688.1 hypothetical protein [Muricauda sp. F6463D]